MKYLVQRFGNLYFYAFLVNFCQRKYPFIMLPLLLLSLQSWPLVVFLPFIDSFRADILKPVLLEVCVFICRCFYTKLCTFIFLGKIQDFHQILGVSDPLKRLRIIIKERKTGRPWRSGFWALPHLVMFPAYFCRD